MDYLLKHSCNTCGYDYDHVIGLDYWTIRKIKILGLAIVLPVLTWMLNGYLIATQICKGTILDGIFSALLCASVVYIVERIIIMAIPAGKQLYRARLILVIIMSVVSSITIKTLFCQKEIRHEIHAQQLLHANAEHDSIARGYQSRINALNKSIGDNTVQYNDLLDRAKKEAVGIGSGRKGIGPIVAYYTAQAEAIQKNRIEPAKKELDGINAEIDQKLKDYQQSELEEAGFMTQMTILLKLSFGSLAGFFVFAIFATLFFLIESIVLMAKHGMAGSALDLAERDFNNL